MRSEIRLREAARTAENLGMHFQVNVASIYMVQKQGLMVTKLNLNSIFFFFFMNYF